MEGAVELDELDKKILALMSRDGRISSAEIARTLGENERKVVYRVNSLLESRTISIFGVISPEIFGYEVIGDVYCQVQVGSLDSVAHKLGEFPEVRYVQSAFGEDDITFQVLAKNTEELHEFVAERLPTISGIVRTKTSIVAKVYKEIHQWLPPEVEICERQMNRA
jgi:Lrp/AsnC family transcriptional regulator for asnA, asnC and gidA